MHDEILLERNLFIPMRDGARVGSGERAEPRLEAELMLEISQDGDVVPVHAIEGMTARAVELRSLVTVNDEERYREQWRRTWRAP